MDIEAALRWAYMDELPKEQAFVDLKTRPDGVAPGWMQMRRIAVTRVVVDNPNIHGVLPDPHAMRGPHPDAVIIANAVQAVIGLPAAFPPDWDPFADVVDPRARRLAGFAAVQALRDVVTRDEATADAFIGRLERLIIKHAILGGAPDWETEPFEVLFVRNASGGPAWFVRTVIGEGQDAREVELDGFDRRRRVPMPNAYQKPYLDPCPRAVALERAEYQLWHTCLDLMAEWLAGKLESIEVTPSVRLPRPWEVPEARRAVVLRDLTEPPRAEKKRFARTKAS
ncbi:MAG: hypothetical protein ACREDP_25415 [Bradyrhizobium sp.]